MKYQSSSSHRLKVNSKVNVLKKVQTPRSRSQGKKCWYLQKGLVTRNTHVKYQIFRAHCSKVIATCSKIKVSDRIAELRNDRITDLHNNRMTDRTK